RLRVLAERDAASAPDEREESAVGDDRLRLMFTCCHPALSRDAQVGLTLRLLGGLTTAEVARAFLVSEATMAQRLVRAKRKIAAARASTRSRPLCASAARATTRYRRRSPSTTCNPSPTGRRSPGCTACS